MCWSYLPGANTDTIEVYIDGSLVQNSTDLYYNGTYSAHATKQIDVRGYNSTAGSYSSNENISTFYSISAGQSLIIFPTYNDADNDIPVFNSNNMKGTFYSNNGILIFDSGISDVDVYDWSITGVLDDTPGISSALTHSTSNFYVNSC